jgi:hypothetical protein
MGISESEYRAMLAGNPELVADDPGVVTAAQLERAVMQGSRTPTEHDEQVALFQWAAANEEEHEELKLLFAVPNGGYRPMATAAQLKAEGVRAGVPDVCLPVARGRFHSLWIEMKRKPNTTSDAQRAWLDALRRYGHCAVVCWSANEAINSIISYLEQE